MPTLTNDHANTTAEADADHGDAGVAPGRLLYLAEATHEARKLETPLGLVAVASAQTTDEDHVNEDAAAVYGLADGSLLLVLADGAGGMPAGRAAAAIAIESLAPGPEHAPSREHVVHAFETANRRVIELGVGAASTLIAAELSPDRRLRTYHAGDSVASLVGQRGKLKAQTIAHNPTAYAVEAGYMTEAESHLHEDRATLSNCLGLEDMRIEIGSPTAIAPRDTLLLATDGVTDNLTTDEIIHAVRMGPLDAAAQTLLRRARERMTNPSLQEGDEGPAHPSKPDDATVVLFRLKRG